MSHSAINSYMSRSIICCSHGCTVAYIQKHTSACDLLCLPLCFVIPPPLIGTGNVPVPRQLTALSQYVIKKVAVHSGGRHALALTVDGKVFSWGEGDEGKLGHYSRM